MPLHAKLRLPHRPRTEGQRRLAWWLLDAGSPSKLYLRQVEMRAFGISDDFRDRLLAGQIEPAEPVAARIARLTRGTVPLLDWYRAPEGGWADRPAAASVLSVAA